MKISEIKALTNNEILTHIGDLKREHMNLRFSKVVSEVKDTARMGKVKKEIARLFTILNQRKK